MSDQIEIDNKPTSPDDPPMVFMMKEPPQLIRYYLDDWPPAMRPSTAAAWPPSNTRIMIETKSQYRHIGKVLDEVVSGVYGDAVTTKTPATRAVNVLIVEVIQAVERRLRQGSSYNDDSHLPVDAWRDQTYAFFNKVMTDYEALYPGDGLYT